VRKLLAYHVFGVVMPDLEYSLTSFVLLLREAVSHDRLLGRGVWTVPLFIFVESGLFFGFFLPGDSLLFTLGVLGAVGRVDLSWLIPFSVLAAILGDQLGYVIGRRSGPALARRFRFVRENIQRANRFYARHGGKTVVLARFLPVLRTFVPIGAGVAGMPHSRFTISNAAGGTIWVLGATLAGYVVGRQIPNAAAHINILVYAVILTSPLVWLLAWIKGRTRKKNPN
jgi:membrane-associated protein